MDPRISLACSQCGEVTQKRHVCGGCRVYTYCGSDCQRAHWDHHRLVCATLPEVVGPPRLVPNTQRFEKLRPRSQRNFREQIRSYERQIRSLQSEYHDDDAIRRALLATHHTDEVPELLLRLGRENARTVAKMRALSSAMMRETLLVTTQATKLQIAYVDGQMAKYYAAALSISRAVLPNVRIPPRAFARMKRHGDNVWAVVNNLLGREVTPEQVDEEDGARLGEFMGGYITEFVNSSFDQSTPPVPVGSPISDLQLTPVGGWFTEMLGPVLSIKEVSKGALGEFLRQILECMLESVVEEKGTDPVARRKMENYFDAMAQYRAMDQDQLDEARRQMTRLLDEWKTEGFARKRITLIRFIDSAYRWVTEHYESPPIDIGERGQPSRAVTALHLIITLSVSMFLAHRYTLGYTSRRAHLVAAEIMVKELDTKRANASNLFQIAQQNASNIAQDLASNTTKQAVFLRQFQSANLTSLVQTAFENILEAEGTAGAIAAPETAANALAPIFNGDKGAAKALLAISHELQRNEPAQSLDDAARPDRVATIEQVGGGRDLGVISTNPRQLMRSRVVSFGRKLITLANQGIVQLNPKSDVRDLAQGFLVGLNELWGKRGLRTELGPRDLVQTFMSEFETPLRGYIENLIGSRMDEFRMMLKPELAKELVKLEQGITALNATLSAEQARLPELKRIANTTAIAYETAHTAYRNVESGATFMTRNPVEQFFYDLGSVLTVGYGAKQVVEYANLMIHTELNQSYNVTETLMGQLFPMFSGEAQQGWLFPWLEILAQVTAELVFMVMTLNVVYVVLTIFAPMIAATIMALLVWAYRAAKGKLSAKDVEQFTQRARDRDFGGKELPSSVVHQKSWFINAFATEAKRSEQFFAGIATGFFPQLISLFSLIANGIRFIVYAMHRRIGPTPQGSLLNPAFATMLSLFMFLSYTHIPLVFTGKCRGLFLRYLFRLGGNVVLLVSAANLLWFALEVGGSAISEFALTRRIPWHALTFNAFRAVFKKVVGKSLFDKALEALK